MPNNTPIAESSTPGKKWYDKSISQIFRSLQISLKKLIDLREGMDQSGTLTNIKNNKRMKGANAWLLMCSIMVASLGLDLNSPAVIIGAMLISPLMSPILGIGLGVGINDQETLFISLKHFAISITIALITSFLYFKFTPFGELTDEIRARTAPTLLDGLVAIFGGIAGIISTTRKDKSNAIPGVAIATALMPPLCVAGYGLAKNEWQFFANAFYLFFLNSFFIAISTYIVIRLLRFRYKAYVNQKERRRNRAIIAIFSIIILIPAINLLLKAIEKVQERQQVETLLNGRLKGKETKIDDIDLIQTDTMIKILLTLAGDPITEDSIKVCEADLTNLLKKPVELTAFQSEYIPLDDILSKQNQMTVFRREVTQKLNTLEQRQTENDLLIKQFTENGSIPITDSLMTAVYQETKINYPLLEEIAFAPKAYKTDFSKQDSRPLLLLNWNRKKSSQNRKEDELKIQKFVQLRTKLDTLEVIGY